MKNKFFKLLSVPLMAPVIAIALAQSASGQSLFQGPSTGSTPYVQPLLPGSEIISVLTTDNTGAAADDSVPNLVGGAPYGMAGIPDGMGAFDNGNGTFTLLVNHEIGNALGTVRAHGAIGSYVSKWIINKSTLAVTGGTDLMTGIYGWNTGTQASNASPAAFAFNRFCSADLPEVSAFYNATSGLGSQERIFMHGEEGGSTGYQQGTVVTGTDAGKSYTLGKFNLTTNGSGLTGVGAWENALANPFAQDKTVVIGNNDGGTGIMANALSVYVGTKTSTGTEVEKAGLMNGTLKFIAVTGFADGTSTIDEFTNTTTHANVIPNGTRFTLSATTSTTFSRPEDGAWNPRNPREYYFNTTDRLDQASDGLGAQIGQTRVWRLTFDDITNPDAGGKIECLIDGRTVAGQKVNMFDNMGVNTATGHIILQEDVGGAAHNGKMWEFDPATFTGATNSGTMTMIAKHDAARFGDVGVAATSPFNNDEETSGIIDITSIMSGSALHKGNPGEAWYISADQAHYTSGISSTQVEGGQIFVLHQIAQPSNLFQASSTGSTPYVLPTQAGTESTSVFTTDNTGATPDDTVPNLVGGAPYGMAGIPDGMGAFDNGNGTFTLLVNHELGNTLGTIRAHGSIGSYVSKWIINKSTLAVTGGTDLMTGIYGWNTGTQASNTTPSTFAFNRFCSADLPEISAFYNATSGLGSQERIFMHGEEGGSTGYQQGTVVTGTDAGKSYTLGKFNLTTNGSGLTGVGAWENALANPFPQDTTLVIGNNDGGAGIMSNALSVYIGTKQATGSEVDKAGLTNGVLKLIAVTGFADGTSTIDEFTNTTTHANVIPNGTRFTLSSTTSTTFSRPEDGAWNPLNPNQFYFNTTDRLDQASDGLGAQIGQTRVWRLTFDDITNPNSGGMIECLIDGRTVAGLKVNMFDNMEVNKTTGHIILQEDVGGAAHNGKMWEFDPATFTGVTNSGTMTLIAKHDPARFGDRVGGITTAATLPFNNDEETSGVIDITGIMAGSGLHKGNPGEAWYISSDQAHYTTGINATQVEGGQFFVLHQIAPVNNAQVTRSGFVRDRRTGTYSQQVTVKNNLATTVAGSFYVVLDGLTAGVSLANVSGSTGTYAPLGSPYVLVPGSAGGLAPGASLSVTLQFTNSSNTAITYTPRVLNAVPTP